MVTPHPPFSHPTPRPTPRQPCGLDLDIDQILAWADAHYARHGDWPTVRSGPIDDAPGETWCAVDSALTLGTRGLPGGASLHQLLQGYRDK